jgi:hypothetical protein
MISTALRERHERVEVLGDERGEEVRREGEVVDRRLLNVVPSSKHRMVRLAIRESNSSKLGRLDRRLEQAVRRLLDQSRELDRTQHDLRLRLKLRPRR